MSCSDVAFDHWYVYKGVPLETFISTAPFVPPLQLTFVCVLRVIVGAPACVIVVVDDVLQKFASVTVHVYVPAARFVIADVVCDVFHKYVSVPVPPLATAVAVPLEMLHVASTESKSSKISGGSFTVKAAGVKLQLLASLIVTE